MSNNKSPIKNFDLYNQSLISRKIGVSQSYISRVMRGLTKNDKVLRKIINVINESSKAA